MNKIIYYMALIIFLFGTYFAEAVSRFEVRSAAFFHSSKLFREIYGNPSFDLQIQASNEVWSSLDVWYNVDGFFKKGQSIGFGDCTQIRIINYSLGLNFIYPLNCQFTLYAGIGPSLGRIFIKNRSHCGELEKESKTVCGGVIKLGVYYPITDCFFVDLFVDYLYQPVKFQNHINIGGVKTGAGIGVQF